MWGYANHTHAFTFVTQLKENKYKLKTKTRETESKLPFSLVLRACLFLFKINNINHKIPQSENLVYKLYIYKKKLLSHASRFCLVIHFKGEGREGLQFTQSGSTESHPF